MPDAQRRPATEWRGAADSSGMLLVECYLLGCGVIRR
jgi:hypothetical protein